MTIYRSQEGEEEIKDCYFQAQHQLDIRVEEQTVNTRHGDTHILVAGPPDGDPILLFHGGNATNPMTLSWYTDLAESYRLIAPDTIGQPGKSAETRISPRSDGYGEWAADILDAFDLESASMIGTSYGGGIVLRSAANTPDRIENMVLVVPAGFGTGPMTSLLKVGLPSLLYRLYPSPVVLEYVLSRLVTNPGEDQIVRSTVAACLRYLNLEHKFPSATKSELQGFSSPVALYAAAEDPFFPAAVVISRAREKLSSVERTVTLEGEKHILSTAAQKQVSSDIQEFLR